MFKDLYRELPLGFRIWAVVAPLLGIGFTGLLAWAIWRLVTHFTGGNA